MNIGGLSFVWIKEGSSQKKKKNNLCFAQSLSISLSFSGLLWTDQSAECWTWKVKGMLMRRGWWMENPSIWNSKNCERRERRDRVQTLGVCLMEKPAEMFSKTDNGQRWGWGTLMVVSCCCCCWSSIALTFSQLISCNNILLLPCLMSLNMIVFVAPLILITTRDLILSKMDPLSQQKLWWNRLDDTHTRYSSPINTIKSLMGRSYRWCFNSSYEVGGNL